MSVSIIVDGLPCELYLPQRPDSGCAVVIVPSSAGVCDIRERRYATHFSGRGMTALIADSFAARGLTQCMTDQFSISIEEMMDDAWKAAAWLEGSRKLKKIGVFGVSKGGAVTLRTAMLAFGRKPEAQRQFVFHVALAPSCAVMPRDARTSGSPILIIAGEADDYTGAESAVRFVKRIKSAGAKVEYHLMDGAHHAWELDGPAKFYPTAQTFRDCTLLINDDGSYLDMESGVCFSSEALASVLRSRMKLGAHAGGGNEKIMARTFDIIDDFLERALYGQTEN